MSRFGPDPQAFFDAVYDHGAPWEIGGVQPAMAELIDRFSPQGPALDLGCASGDLSIHLARRGLDVLGVDFAAAAIAQAEAKRSPLPREVAGRLTFTVADAAHPSALGRFGAIFDSGFLHLLDATETGSLIDELAGALLPGGRLYLHEFAVEFPIENVPRAVTEDEVRERFTAAAGWRILHVAAAEFHSTVAAPTPAIVACVEKE